MQHVNAIITSLAVGIMGCAALLAVLFLISFAQDFLISIKESIVMGKTITIRVDDVVNAVDMMDAIKKAVDRQVRNHLFYIAPHSDLGVTSFKFVEYPSGQVYETPVFPMYTAEEQFSKLVAYLSEDCTIMPQQPMLEVVFTKQKETA